MIRELLEAWGSLSPPQLHLAFLTILGTAAVLVVIATVGVCLRRHHGGPVVRALALVAAGLVRAPNLGLFHLTLIVFLAGASLVVSATAAASHTAPLMAATQGMASLGTLVFLTLLSAVPAGTDPTWEIERFYEFGIFMTSGFILLLGVGFVSARRQSIPTAVAFSLLGALGLVTMGQGYAHHPGPSLSVTVAPWLPVIGAAGWIFWLWWRQRAPTKGSRTSGWLRKLESRWHDHPATLIIALGAPIAMAGMALVFAGSGSAREASRVRLAGLDITPGLAVPFFFAVALGVVVGREQWRWRGWGGILLTVALTLLLLAQKEVGNTAVVLMVAAIVFLIAQRYLVSGLSDGAVKG